MIAAPHALVLTLLMAPAAPRSTPEPAYEGRPRALGPVGLAGLLIGTAGIGLASVGTIRLAEGRTHTVSPSDGELVVTTDLRPQGRALLGAGLGITAVGLTVLVLDLTVLRRQRARRMALVPVLGPTIIGLSFRGRFEVQSWR